MDDWRATTAAPRFTTPTLPKRKRTRGVSEPAKREGRVGNLISSDDSTGQNRLRWDRVDRETPNSHPGPHTVHKIRSQRTVVFRALGWLAVEYRVKFRRTLGTWLRALECHASLKQRYRVLAPRIKATFSSQHRIPPPYIRVSSIIN